MLALDAATHYDHLKRPFRTGHTMSESNPLRLMALDSEDLEILAAHLQDAVLKVSDIAWSPGKNQAILTLNRFAWEAGSAAKGRKKTWQRRRAVLHFDQVKAVRSSGIDRARPDDVLSLLTIQFEETDPPSGIVHLVFAGDSALRIEVDVLEAQLTDLGSAWSTTSRPRHGTG